MKNKKVVILSFLLVAVLCVGVGFAALTDILDIQGTAEVGNTAAEEAFNEDIYFSAAVANETGNDAAVLADNDKATFTAKTLKGKDDTVTFTFTVKNDGDLDAQVTPEITANDNETYFSCAIDWTGAKTIAAGASETITVTVKLLKTPTETINGSFTVKLTATAGATTGA